MRKKKEIPLIVLESLEPFLLQNNNLYKTVDPKSAHLRIEDLDDNSDFYFVVENYKQRNGKTYLQLDYKPHSKLQIGNYRPEIEYTQLSNIFTNWENILKDYDKIKSIYEDPIIVSNAKYFYDKYEIVDEDASVTSFNIEQILFLEEYIDEAKQKLQIFKEDASENELAQITQLELEADAIRDALTKESKNAIIKRLSSFWGRSQKLGLPIIKEIFIKVIAEITSKLLTGG